ncbi:MAG: Asp-tRNA(Asn)/Glu-tRNA(Gln) amidotransferase subunit GatA [Simkaniaceae bacterium]|nr:Asp-tRNA(Asn)/Glu-tRNA(Gln) amidotransferase subunit GatA [Simkaniaceae bacterium]
MYSKSAFEIAHDVKEGKVTAREVAKYFLNRSEKDTSGAFLRLLEKRALSKADAVDAKIRNSEKVGRLAGVPIAIKDNIHIKGELSTCASKMLENYEALFDATVIDQIEREDGIVIGKTNLDEFAMGSSTEYSAFQKTVNPWNPAHSPGGSSGGSSAAVSAKLAPISLGSDTGGSIRQPASFTGTVGFKPTYGRISRHGLVAFGSSFDCIGPFAGCVKDIALMMEVMGHHCSYDSTSIPAPAEPYLDHLNESIQGKKIGVPFASIESLNDEQRQIFDSALEKAKGLGAEIVPVSLELIHHSIPIYYILATAEASTNLARYDGVGFSTRSKQVENIDDLYANSKEEGFGPEVKQRILLGTYVLSSGFQDAYYKKASKVRRLMIDEFHRAFLECDVIAMPTAPTTAFEIGSIKDPVEMYLQDIFTICANVAGIPAISIPSGRDSKGLPCGLQLMAPMLQDGRVLRFAHHLEEALGTRMLVPEAFDKELV